MDTPGIYEAKTGAIRVRVEPEFIEERSSPEEGHYFWTYTVQIDNEGEESVQLMSRVWLITDEAGRREEVRGKGVVGQCPTIGPGESFNYTSGCPLATPSGIMVGSYQMRNEDGQEFTVQIPAFSLDCPYAIHSMN